MINYKQVTDKLQSSLPTDESSKFWCIELEEYYIESNQVVLINLLYTGNGNKYRLYHSELNDYVKNDKELFECCLGELKEIYYDIKLVMSSALNNMHVMLNMEEQHE